MSVTPGTRTDGSYGRTKVDDGSAPNLDSYQNAAEINRFLDGLIAVEADHNLLESELVAGTRPLNAVLLTERADHVNPPTAGRAELWVRSSDGALMYTDENGVDRAVSQPSPFPIALGGRFSASLNTWVGHNVNAWQTQGTAATAFGAGAAPDVAVQAVAPIVPVNGTITRVFYEFLVGSTAMTGTANVVRLQSTSGSAVLTESLVGVGADLSVATSGTELYHDEEVLSVPVVAGDRLGLFVFEPTAAAVVICSAVALIQPN